MVHNREVPVAFWNELVSTADTTASCDVVNQEHDTNATANFYIVVINIMFHNTNIQVFAFCFCLIIAFVQLLQELVDPTGGDFFCCHWCGCFCCCGDGFC